MNKYIDFPKIEKYQKFFIVRDDLIDGGTKAAILPDLIDKIENKELVYAADEYGHGQLALAIAGLIKDRRVLIFYPKLKTKPEVFRQTVRLHNVNIREIESESTQRGVYKYAEKYAAKTNSYLFPIGFNIPDFHHHLKERVAKIDFKYSEVWVPFGSGALARAVKLCWQDAKVVGVDLGLGGIVPEDIELFKCPELPFEKAKKIPPYPSSIYYDAKMWQHIVNHAKENALVWNVG